MCKLSVCFENCVGADREGVGFTLPLLRHFLLLSSDVCIWTHDKQAAQSLQVLKAQFLGGISHQEMLNIPDIVEDKTGVSGHDAAAQAEHVVGAQVEQIHAATFE